MPPTPRDMASFFRLGLRISVCPLSAVVAWADSIITREPSPHIAFLELSTSGSQSIHTVISFLDEVPGPATPELPGRMLLGWCHRLIRTGASDANDLLVRLYRLSSSAGELPPRVRDQLTSFDDDLYLARHESYGTPEEVAAAFTEYLAPFAGDAPSLSDELPRPS